jgi:hypothetical protein
VRRPAPAEQTRQALEETLAGGGDRGHSDREVEAEEAGEGRLCGKEEGDGIERCP